MDSCSETLGISFDAMPLGFWGSRFRGFLRFFHFDFGKLDKTNASPPIRVSLIRTMTRALGRYAGKIFAFCSALAFGLSGSLVSQTPAFGSNFQAELVGELNPGASHAFSSTTNRTAVFQERIYFWADDGSGFALWSYDGSSYAKPPVDVALPAGEPGLPSSQSFAIFQSKLYFTGTVSAGAEQELFVFSGTEISLAYNFEDFPAINLPVSGLSNGNVDSLMATPHGLFLSANGHVVGQPEVYSRALWRWDGTLMHFAGITNPAGSNNTGRLTWIDDKLYFSADGPLGNSRPWVYDPTLAWSSGPLDSATNPADLGIIGSQSAHYVTGFGSVGSKVYFGSEGFDSGVDIGKELWVYDPALPIQAEASPQTVPRNPSLVADFRAGSANSDPTDFVSAQGWLFFRLFPTSSAASIYAIDESGTVRDATGLQTYFQANNMTSFGHLRSFDDQLVFGSPFSNFGIFTYDRLQDEVTEIVPARAATGNYSALSLFQGKLYWIEGSDAAVGRELYRFDSTELFPQEVVGTVSPPSYSGPIIESVNPNPARAGSVITITGQRLSGVDSLSIDNLEVDILETSATTISASLPTALFPGLKDLVVFSDSGRLTVQDALEVAVAVDTSPIFYTKLQADRSHVKVYAKNIVSAGKVQFFHNGREIAWVRAMDETDPKLRGTDGFSYLVRSVFLMPGKNIFEIYVDGERVRRTAYTLR